MRPDWHMIFAPLGVLEPPDCCRRKLRRSAFYRTGGRCFISEAGGRNRGYSGERSGSEVQYYGFVVENVYGCLRNKIIAHKECKVQSYPMKLVAVNGQCDRR